MSATCFSVEALRAIVGERGVITDDAGLEPYCSDWRHMFHGKALCAVLPRKTEEVAAVVRLCASFGIAIVPHGGNTGLSGGATPDGSGQQVVLCLSRMNAIREIDVIGETIELEAGVILQTAQVAAAEAGLLLPISLAAEGSASIGGVISTNAGGTNVLRYGMARGRILGLEVVTAQGEIINGLRRLRKDNAGYDWKQWFIGTEGTLGIVTAAVLQLGSLPQHRVTALLALPSAEAALQLLRAARQAIGETLNAFELMSGAALELVERHQKLKTPLAASPWYVLLEASSSLPSLREATETLLSGVLERNLATDCVLAESERQESELWALRESITEAESREGRSVKHDVSVPISAIPEFLRMADEAVGRSFTGARINAFGHAGDGNIHYNVVVSDDLDGAALNTVVNDLVVAHGGSISAEHGIGQYRVSELRRCRSNAELAIAERLKRALDPQGLLNPGKVLSSVNLSI
jgi:FAD/FMN-containing dehydrogenase